ncbi:MAG: nucleotide exchange factor GrpE [Thaumarchaeota archaeon]|nr:nucleotide exchange factor GrpE [Nitrososphaerota archaeon]
MQEDSAGAAGEEELGRLREELAEKNEELTEMKSRLESVSRSDLDAELDKAQRLIEQEKTRGADYLVQLKYLQADFENYRKRVDREIRELEDFSTSALIRKLLPVLDDLELAASSAEKSEESKGFLEGFEMVQKNLTAVLQSEGLRPIEAVDKPFDPELHEAVERVDGTGNSRDMVVGEIRKGYILKDKVLRPSMVRVESAVKDNGEKQ